MERHPISWTEPLLPEQLYQAVATVADEFGLNVGMTTELKYIPGSIHWHLNRGKRPGTLEVTLVPRTRDGFVSVHGNRTAPWIATILPEFRARLEEVCDSR